MSVKRASKVQKRNQKKKQQLKKQAKYKVKKQIRVGRLDLDQVTPQDQVMATMMSDDVPESEWHPDDVSTIKRMLAESKEATGEECVVKRRPDGTLTIFSAPVFEGEQDWDLDLEDDEDDEVLQVSLDEELDSIINNGVVIGINDKDSDFRESFGEYVSNHSPVLALMCKERLKPILAKHYKSEGIKYTQESLNEAAMERLSYLELYVKPNYEADIEQVLKEFGEHSFFPPDFVWIKGKIYDIFDM